MIEKVLKVPIRHDNCIVVGVENLIYMNNQF